MKQRELSVVPCGRSKRLSLREYSDWRRLSCSRLDAGDQAGIDRNRFEIERVDRHGITGYHLYPKALQGKDPFRRLAGLQEPDSG